ncbi:MAG: alpha/beta hydrolase [Hyphomonadaceae bacterium]|nr:alpha/beta hydrolase [Hyphomonadaceae bacterium]
MSDDLRRRVRAIGAALSPEMFSETIGMYAPKALKPAAVGARVERDIAYGAHARHKLDLFAPADAANGAPVLLYVHGGGFVQGDKGGEGAPFYNNIGAWAAAEGFVGATMTYRLAPDHPWPAGAEDLAAAVDWLRANVGRHGGDPGRIFVCGQSAGAAHVASYVAMPRLHGAGPPIAGAIMLSGFYDVVRAQHSKFENAYYGMDASRFAEQSSLRGLIESSIPLLFTVAEYDGPPFQNQAALLVQDWFEAKGSLPRMLYLPDGNHMSAALGIGTPGDPLAEEIAAFIRKFG